MLLSELPSADQGRFLALNITSHIYTDDPSLCAVVIDGQRLGNGDRFAGLKVFKITPTGVIFEEQGDRPRRVEVNPFD